MVKPGGPHPHNMDEVDGLPEALSGLSDRIDTEETARETVDTVLDAQRIANTQSIASLSTEATNQGEAVVDHEERLAALEGAPDPDPDPDPNIHVAWSQFRDRVLSDRLNGDTLQGEVVIFLELDQALEAEIQSVAFQTTWGHSRTESFWPYDLMGGSVETANLFDVESLADDAYTVIATVTFNDDRPPQTYRGDFVTDSVVVPPVPPPAGHDEIAPGDDWNLTWGGPGRELRWLPGVHGPQHLTLPRGGSAADPLTHLVVMAGATIDGGVPDAHTFWDPTADPRRGAARWSQSRLFRRYFLNMNHEDPPWNYHLEGSGLAGDEASTIQHYQCWQQAGAVAGDSSPVNFEMSGMSVLENGYAAIRGNLGANHHHNIIARNAQQAMGGIYSGHGPGAEAIFAFNHCFENNTLGVDPITETVNKFVRSHDLRYHHNLHEDEDGVSIWGDIANGPNVEIADNHVYRAFRQGISWEINVPYGLAVPSPGAAPSVKILRNHIEGCGWRGGHDLWAWGAGILVLNSSQTLVEGNTVIIAAEGGDGIMIVNQVRTLDGERVYARHNAVLDNTIEWKGSHGTHGAVDDTHTRGGPHAYADAALNSDGLTSGNRYDGNHYKVPAARRHSSLFWENGGAGDFEWFQAQGHEARGTIETTA